MVMPIPGTVKWPGRYTLTPSSMQSRTGRTRSTPAGHEAPDEREPTDPAQALRLLSQREREVLDLLARGCSNSRIAFTLFLAEQTAKNHVSAICDKLHLENRYEVIRRADYLRELSR